MGGLGLSSVYISPRILELGLCMEIEHREHIVSEIARGLRPWTDLELLGVRVRCDRNGIGGRTRYVVEEPQGVDLRAGVVDVAKGVLRWQLSPRELSDWASALLVLLDFYEFEDHWAGDLLLGALWDACFEGEISPDTIREIYRITGVSDTG